MRGARGVERHLWGAAPSGRTGRQAASNYFGTYRKYMRKFGVLIQFCLADLIRDVKFLATLPDKKQKAYGQRVNR